MRFDFSDLQLFLSVVDAGSITGGAQRVNLALASASERLKNIEADAGVILLRRHARGIAPTEAGEALAHHARILLQQRTLMRGELHDFAAGSRGSVRLYANTAAQTGFPPARLAPWLAARPRLTLELKERTSVEIVQLIMAGFAEIGIVSNSVDTGDLHLEPVADDHLAIIMPAAHRLAQARTVHFMDILGESFVGLAPGSALQDHIRDHARACGRELMLRIQMSSFEGLCEMVSHGVGIAIVPRRIASRHHGRYRYAITELADAWSRRQLCLCYRTPEALSPAARSLADHLAGRSG